MLSLEDIFIAYYDCRRNKRNTTGALEFELHYETECIRLFEEIVNKEYVLRPNTAFIVHDPVKREIFASHFRDRIVHHLIARKLEPILERVLIHDVYNSRKEKGTHFGIRRITKFLRSASDNYTGDVYILKLDIQGFFMSIDKELLWEKMKNLICHPEGNGGIPISCAYEKDTLLYSKGDIERDSSATRRNDKNKSGIPEDEQEVLLYLIKIIIFSNVKKDVVIYGDRTDWIGLPKSKSLFYAKDGCGLPIGNLTSQLFANIYMHEFDIFIKKTLKIQYYGRYVDDFILIHHDKDYLKFCIREIRTFLSEQLGLTLHPKKIYFQHSTKGVLFLGTYIKPWRTYTGKRTKGNCYKLIESINTRLTQDEPLGEEEVNMILSQINSYLGLMSHTRSYRLRKKMMRLFHKRFFEYFESDENLIKVCVKKVESNSDFTQEKIPS